MVTDTPRPHEAGVTLWPRARDALPQGLWKALPGPVCTHVWGRVMPEHFQLLLTRPSVLRRWSPGQTPASPQPVAEACSPHTLSLS